MDDDLMPQTIAALVQRIVSGYDELEQFIAMLNEHQVSGVPDAHGWMIKDHLAHLAVWEHGITALLRRESRYAAMGLDREAAARYAASGDYDEVNAAIFRRYCERPILEIRNLFERVHRDLLATLMRMADEDLFHPYSFYAPDEGGEEHGEPVVGWIAGNTYQHYAEHLIWMKAQLGGRGLVGA